MAINQEEKEKIKYEYECGVHLIDLAIKYHKNYGTLRNIAAKQKWKKGIRHELISLADQLLESEKNSKTRERVKRRYKSMTKKQSDLIYEKLKNGEEIDKDEAEALLKTNQAISELFKIDKILHNINTSKEEQEIMYKKLKNQELIKELEPDNERAKLIE